MGPELFRQGISRFLSKYAYKNAVTGDLWSELQEVAGSNLNISLIMDTWTRQMGYPVLKVQDIGAGRYKISQDRFLADPSQTYDARDSQF